ncbi:MAG: YciI family protein [Pseudomonadota bacterium]
MYVILLRFSRNKASAGEFMASHNAWLKQGFDDGVFLLAGTLQPSAGGGIVAEGTGLADLEARISQDPFVAEDVVTAEILEITPSRADDRLSFMLPD